MPNNFKNQHAVSTKGDIHLQGRPERETRRGRKEKMKGEKVSGDTPSKEYAIHLGLITVGVLELLLRLINLGQHAQVRSSCNEYQMSNQLCLASQGCGCGRGCGCVCFHLRRGCTRFICSNKFAEKCHKFMERRQSEAPTDDRLQRMRMQSSSGPQVNLQHKRQPEQRELRLPRLHSAFGHMYVPDTSCAARVAFGCFGGHLV